jgi:tetratricopeptide (TPR) repeat protein
MVKYAKILRLIWSIMLSFWLPTGHAANPLDVTNRLSSNIIARIVNAQQQAQGGKVEQAITILRSIKTSRPFDRAYLQRLLGIYYWQIGETIQAIEHLSDAVTSNQLTPSEQNDSRRMLADLLALNHQYPQALVHYYHFVTQLKPMQSDQQLSTWQRISQIEYQLRHWEKVLDAVSQIEQLNAPSSVTTLSIKLDAQWQLNRFNQTIVTLKQLIALQPNQSKWWFQLANAELKKGTPQAALSTLQLAKLAGVEFSQPQLIRLAQLYAKQGIPERAARLLASIPDQNKELIVLQANYWQQAKEWQHAIDMWSLAAHNDAHYFWNIALLQFQIGQYIKTLTSLENLSQTPAEALLSTQNITLMKIRTLYKLQQWDEALIQAQQLNKTDPSLETEHWIRYLTLLKKHQTSGGKE